MGRETIISKLPRHKDNPFISVYTSPDMTRKTEIFYDGNKALVNTQTGEIEENQIAVGRIRYVESEQFVKLYIHNVAGLFDLGKPAQKVMSYLIEAIGTKAINKGSVLLDFGEFEEYCKTNKITAGSRQSFSRGLSDLATKDIVARSNIPNVWHINPAFLFNGDRARFITEIRKKKKSNQEIAEEAGQMRLIGDE